MVTIVCSPNNRLYVDGVPLSICAMGIAKDGSVGNLHDIAMSGHMPRGSVINWNGVCAQAVLAHVKMGFMP